MEKFTNIEDLRKKKEELGEEIKTANDNFREKLRKQARRGKRA